MAAALAECRHAFWSVAVFSGAVNLLMLAGPLYMLQIYDRVLASRSVPTLIALTIFLVGAYTFQAGLDLVRSRIIVRGAMLLDRRLATRVHAAVLRLARQSLRAGDAHQPVRDLDQIRAFLTGAGPVAIVDMPWMPVFLIACFLIHPWLGLLALAGAAILLAMTFLTERTSRRPASIMAQDYGARLALTEGDRRNSETIVAMGMEGRLRARWAKANDRYLAALARSSDVINTFGSVSRVLRLFLQSAMLGLGAYLVIEAELTAGAMIAASIMMGRALAPIEGAIANWRGFAAARRSIRRLSDLLARLPPDRLRTVLPKPCRSLDVESVTVVLPGTKTVLLRDIHFSLSAGESLGIVGSNAVGKTSFMRTMVGIWPPGLGTVRLDGATLDQWDAEALGCHIGYVAQTTDLFDGTIAENISRMDVAPNSEAVLAAARAAGAHEMILRFPHGYDTRIGEAGIALSAGQRQRLALARALYGDPFLIALDEPHASLDSDGEAMLNAALQAARQRGAIVVLIAHRPSALACCDKVLVLANGRQQMLGPRDAVMPIIRPRAVQPVTAPGNLRAVPDSM
ncbi:MAG: type I secretion system permease/ATPase [Xanthobacteraceae bacterium]